MEEQYWNTTLRYVDAFMVENAHSWCDLEDYSLQTDHYAQYQEILHDYCSYFEQVGLHAFATYLAYYQEIRYISFEEFEARLLESTQALLQYVYALRRQMSVAVILRLAYPIEKSNMWVARLVYDRLRPILDGVDCNRRLNDTPPYSFLVNQVDRILMIYPDDCIYSGTQFYNLIWSEQHFFESIRPLPEQVEYYALCPFISTQLPRNPQSIAPVNFGVFEPIERLSTNLLSLISEQQTLADLAQFAEPGQVNQWMQILGDQLSAYSLDAKFMFVYRQYRRGPIPEFVQRIHDFFMFKKEAGNTLNVYFQHKLADRVSVITHILVYGSAPGREIGSLVRNCPYDGDKEYFATDDFREEEDRCPPSCYKYIGYTWSGIPLQDQDYRKPLADLLYRQ